MKILEEKLYEKSAIEELLGTYSRQGVTRKLDRYNVDYEISGRGDYKIDIKAIPDKFKMFCITELRVPAQTDFDKLKYFLYFFFCDEEFQRIPNDTKQTFMSEHGVYVSRQTMTKWINLLHDRNWINIGSTYRYYFAYDGNIEETDQESYNKAWNEYYAISREYKDCYLGVAHVINNFGGMPKKHPLPDQNAFYAKEIQTLTDLVTESIEYDNNLSQTINSKT